MKQSHSCLSSRIMYCTQPHTLHFYTISRTAVQVCLHVRHHRQVGTLWHYNVRTATSPGDRNFPVPLSSQEITVWYVVHHWPKHLCSTWLQFTLTKDLGCWIRQMWVLILPLKNYLFTWKADWQRKRRISSIYWLIPQMPETSRAEPGCSQEPRTPWTPTWVAGISAGLPGCTSRKLSRKQSSQVRNVGVPSSGLTTAHAPNLSFWSYFI